LIFNLILPPSEVKSQGCLAGEGVESQGCWGGDYRTGSKAGIQPRLAVKLGEKKMSPFFAFLF